MKVVAAVPCFNTGRIIGDIVARAKGYVDQVIVVNDGSHDDTLEEAKEAGALIVDHAVNRGYGEAIRSCFEAARTEAADVLVILDGDGQHDPDEIPLVLDPILKGEADLVIGSRFITNENRMPRYRRFGISVITFLYNLGSRTKVSDAQSGFRVYARKVSEGILLTEKGMGISIETLEKARRKGTIIKEIPISCRYSSSPFNSNAMRHGLSVALSVVRIRLKESLRSLYDRYVRNRSSSNQRQLPSG